MLRGDSVPAGKRSVDYAAAGSVKSLVNIVGPLSTKTDSSTPTQNETLDINLELRFSAS